MGAVVARAVTENKWSFFFDTLLNSCVSLTLKKTREPTQKRSVISAKYSCLLDAVVTAKFYRTVKLIQDDQPPTPGDQYKVGHIGQVVVFLN